MAIRTFHRDEPDLFLELISSDARMVVYPGVGAEQANMNWVKLEVDERNTVHAHSESEDTIFILSGRGTVEDLTNDVRLEFQAGDAIHVPPGVRHAVCADRGAEVLSVGGPCPPDWALLRAAGLERPTA